MTITCTYLVIKKSWCQFLLCHSFIFIPSPFSVLLCSSRVSPTISPLQICLFFYHCVCLLFSYVALHLLLWYCFVFTFFVFNFAFNRLVVTPSLENTHSRATAKYGLWLFTKSEGILERLRRIMLQGCGCAGSSLGQHLTFGKCLALSIGVSPVRLLI